MVVLKKFFNKEEENKIVNAIKKAEKNTSGEIRVRIERKCNNDVEGSACKAFENLGMRKTELHNGVLFYFAIEDKKFVIMGDDGINKKVPKDFWNSTRDIMQKNFKENDIVSGLVHGIKEAGKQLSKYFPYEKDDINELSDSISYENDKNEENIESEEINE